MIIQTTKKTIPTINIHEETFIFKWNLQTVLSSTMSKFDTDNHKYKVTNQTEIKCSHPG